MNTAFHQQVIGSLKLKPSRGILNAIHAHALAKAHSLVCKLFGPPVLGNPLHEAWSADGEPLARITPDEMAKTSAMRYVILPHNRGQ